ncbi:alpha/beta hydrolase [Mangrovimonas spongiae]|uniref:Alpha/beta hydrolase n=1 Tax=Mangrovimonas spongiae TaxID=2494697 RepID=A0A3R9MFI4_9FLAO|nr:alpha/beta hydrolase [Mangrovimonas spongiae]RSK39216.1 alpha/beta hydrolase [Mangrovimonas spongiae]
MKNLARIILITFIVFPLVTKAQDTTFQAKEIAITKLIDGTLLTPNNKTSNLVIIIAGSGPTDRNGNQNFMKNNSLKKLAEGITKNGIATFRYDKRSVKLIKQGKINDNNILFDDFVTDAQAVVNYFVNTKTYKNIYIAGHSQGSLIGLLASNKHVAGFISLSGAGKSIDNVLLEQIEKSAPIFKEPSEKVLASLKKGQTTSDYPPALASLFNEDLQPFMINWIQYNPQEIIAKLEIPCLIINGTKDLQVSVEEAQLLHQSAKNSTLKIIDNMNHIFFTIKGDTLENSKSYNESARSINPEVVKAIVDFIK